MSMEYIRQFYGVPAKRGARVAFELLNGEVQTGTIVASDGAKLKVRFDGNSHTSFLHPTYNIRYLEHETRLV